MTADAALGFAPSEDPFVVEHGGFYRRWLSMIDDLAELEATVARLDAIRSVMNQDPSTAPFRLRRGAPPGRLRD